MPQEVKIRINSSQLEGLDKNEIAFKTKGLLYNKKGIYYLKYKEDLEGLKGVETTLKIKEDELTLIRQGQVRMIQEFVLDKQNNFDYHTPYGTLSFQVEVEELNIDVDFFQGVIDLSYQLYNGEELISKNQLNIIYKED
ncbi:uncharacterized beta-barrel protein YwiB (DUF1934 family) [Orenia metallireducens]|uniref:Uncharacterized beta-barrel protein YwiB, DUF1934 family n=1 Tax=Orenia metallireducens TaxID=1413210 RepID=A0A285GNM5_9FIRM|nr:DUF1934 domain-containing protein [Orenia metallireducens]PRX35790.1 uncharacterized beta-barrel protein YwiB (DUF1934 family) [Orenia metallireducens]SNY23941.1 Uncharacterized beta-barrel protein YwiB, DUF1934 family [Orenia metallireducens]